MIWPHATAGPIPSPDMPEAVRGDYEEARAVFNKSPRASAALLRMAVEKLCRDLVPAEDWEDLNKAVGYLVKKGLDVQIQQSLDSLRVIGNEVVHAGTLDVRDEPETAAALFELLNFIVEQMITRPKRISSIYAKIPANKLKGIQDRDKSKS